MILTNHNQARRPGLRMVSIALTFVFALALTVSFARVDVAAATFTTISVQDPNGPVRRAKVTVFDASNGRQIAGGLADPETGLFVFHSPLNQQLIVSVHTRTGYVGSAHVSPGTFAVVAANRIASETPTVGILGGQITFTLVDENAAPLVGANVAVVAWGSFERVARGTTDEQGQFTFRVPKDMATDDFLATMWSDGGALTLAAAVHPRDHSDSPMGGIWLDATFPNFGRLN